MASCHSLLFWYYDNRFSAFKLLYNNLIISNNPPKTSPFRPEKHKKTFFFVAFRFFLFKFAAYINIYEHENHVMAKPWHGENLNYPYHKLKTVK